MIWLLLLPFRLFFGLIFGLLALPFVVLLLPLALLVWIPFMLLKFTLRLAAAVILVPLGLLFGAVVLIVGGLAASAVFLPLLLIGAGLWFLFRGATRLSPI